MGVRSSMEHHGTRAASPTAAATTGAFRDEAAGPLSPICCDTPQRQQRQSAAAQQLKSLQRTPLPLILARMKVLLERLNMLMEEGPCSPTAAATAGVNSAAAAAAVPNNPAGLQFQACHTSHRRQDQQRTPEPTAAAGAGASAGSRGHTGVSSSRKGGEARKPVKLVEVSVSGGVSPSVMSQSAESILDELEVTLGFISEFLDGLPPHTRKALAACARLESHKKDQVIYSIGDEPSHFYIVLSGRVDIWTSSGTHRSKSVVSVLRRGDAFGDQAIINGEPHGTAASPATNVTLLVVTRANFLSVLGSHFRDVAAKWQRSLVTHVAPLAECDPHVVRRLCSMLVSEQPAAGQEWSLHDNNVCFFIQAGTFEVRLVDLQAKQAAQAALAAAIASSSSALPIAPIPPHLRLGRGGRPNTACLNNRSGISSSSNNSNSRRPTSAPTGPLAARPAVAAAAAAAHNTSVALGGPQQQQQQQLWGAAGAAAGMLPAGASGSTAATGGSTGGSSGNSQATAAVVATPGASDVAAGLGLLQGCPALATEGVLASVRVKDGRLVGTQGLAKQLRQQHSSCVPYKVVGELGCGGWFGGGEAIYGCGPLQTALVVVAVGPGCELVHAPLSGLEKHGGPELLRRLRDDAAFKLTYWLGRTGVLGRGQAVGHPQSTLVAEAAAAAAAAHAANTACGASSTRSGGQSIDANSSTGGGGTSQQGRSPCSTFKSTRPTSAAAAAAGAGGGGAAAAAGVGGAVDKRCALAAGITAAATNEPVLAAKKCLHARKQGQATAAPVRRCSSSSTDSRDSQAASTPDSTGTGDTALSSSSNCSSGRQDPLEAASTAAPAAGAAAVSGDAPSVDSQSVGVSSRVVVGKDKQKHVHVPGSGVFSPGVMSALQHVRALQGSLAHAAAAPSAAAATVSLSEGVHHAAAHSSQQPPHGSNVTEASSSSSSSGSSSWGQQSHWRGHRPGSAAARVTAAEVYWQQPDHSSTATGAALSNLLPTLFTDGLEPLVTELDCMLQLTGTCSQDQQQQQHPLAWPSGCLQQQQNTRQQLRPGSAAARLQRPSSAASSVRHQASRPHTASTRGVLPEKQQQKGWGPLPCASDVLRHQPRASLLAASVLWQRSSAAAFRPPLRQCLTAGEIAAQHTSEADEAVGVL